MDKRTKDTTAKKDGGRGGSHTPLPWRLRIERIRRDTAAILAGGAGNDLIARLSMDTLVNPLEMKGNAELIVRAANHHHRLLAACKALAAICETVTDLDAAEVARIRDARTAIAAAEAPVQEANS